MEKDVRGGAQSAVSLRALQGRSPALGLTGLDEVVISRGDVPHSAF